MQDGRADHDQAAAGKAKRSVPKAAVRLLVCLCDLLHLPLPLAGKLQSDDCKGRMVAATAAGTAARVRREARKSNCVCCEVL